MKKALLRQYSKTKKIALFSLFFIVYFSSNYPAQDSLNINTTPIIAHFKLDDTVTFQNRFHALRKKRNNAKASQQVHEKILEQPLAPVKKERKEKPKLYRAHKKLKKRSTLIPPK